MLRDSSLFDSTMEFRRIVAGGTLTEQPKMLNAGLSFPSQLNSGTFTTSAKDLFGPGSEGVPSTLAHLPTLEPMPIILCNAKDLSSMASSTRIMFSVILTKGKETLANRILNLSEGISNAESYYPNNITISDDMIITRDEVGITIKS